MCSWFGGLGTGSWFGGGMFMMLPMLIFWGLVIWGGIMLVRKLSQSSQSACPIGIAPGAIDILKERYAKGEISREEFAHMKQELLK